MYAVSIVYSVEDMRMLVSGMPSDRQDVLYAIPFFHYLDKHAKLEAINLCKQSSPILHIFSGEYDVALAATRGAANWEVKTLPFSGPLQLYEYMEAKRMSNKFNIPFDNAMNHLYRID